MTLTSTNSLGHLYFKKNEHYIISSCHHYGIEAFAIVIITLIEINSIIIINIIIIIIINIIIIITSSRSLTGEQGSS